MKTRITIIVVFIYSFAVGQLSVEEQRAVDSLINIVETTNDDTIKINALNIWDDYIYITDPALDFEINLQIEAICKKHLKNPDELDEKSLMFYRYKYATCLNILGLIFQDQGNYRTSIDYHFQSLKCCEELKDTFCLSRSYNNIGLLHSIQDNHEEALLYYNKKLAIEKKIGNEKSLALVLSNIGRVYYNIDSLDKANDYFQSSLEIRERLNLESYLADSYNEIAMLYQKQNKLDSILYYYKRSLQVYQDLSYARGISSVYTNIANYYVELKDYKNAEKYLKQAYALDTVSHNYEDLANSSLGLYNVYNAIGNYKEALKMYQVNMDVNDSIFSNKNARAMMQQQFSYDYEKKIVADSLKLLHEKEVMDAELMASEAEIKRQEEQKYFFIGGLFLALIFGAFVLNRYRVTRKQKRLIEIQKKKVDEQRKVLSETNVELKDKNLQITDSINYAQRIQKAVLPSKSEFSSCFSDSFIFYRPKDVVSGDFYWFNKKGDNILFAAADCTGHGVPGAFMSIVGNNLLDKITANPSFQSPDLILNQLNIELHESLNKDKSADLSDGMDIALCSINLKTNKLLFSGAHNPLYLIRNGELVEYKGDRLHLGDRENTSGKDFSLVEVTLQKGDILYVFSDGFADQKGGPKEKKYFYQPFKDLLIEISAQPMEKQKEILDETITTWRGAIPQFDDMLIIGVKIG